MTERMTADEFRELKKKRRRTIRTGGRNSPNKLEREFRDMTALSPHVLEILFEPVRLLLPSGNTYTPDFGIRFTDTKRITLVEVKTVVGEKLSGSRDSIVRLREAAYYYRNFFTFQLSIREDGEWASTILWGDSEYHETNVTGEK